MIEPGRGAVVLDAALGTRLIARGLRLDADDPCLWSLDRPDLVAAVHARDVAAGSTALLTNTFGANRRWLARFGRADGVGSINRRATALARAAAGAGRLVIGAVGPTAAAEPRALREQVDALLDAGVDALVFETHSAGQARAALRAVRGRARVPLYVSLVSWPDPPGVTARRLEDLGASALGENCQRGMGPALATARRLAGVTRLPLWIKPAAGLPGEPPATPESFAAAVPALLASGVRFLGGCCGTTEAHVAALHAACYPG